MERRPLNVLAFLSLILGAALLMGWAKAQFGDAVWVRFVGHSVLVFGADGAQIGSARGFFFEPSPGDATYVGAENLVRQLRAGSLYGNPVGVGRFAGVTVCWNLTPASGFRALIVPVIYPIALAAVLPCLWAVSRRRARRRVRRRHCAACGYDLRASPGGCPECGSGREAA